MKECNSECGRLSIQYAELLTSCVRYLLDVGYWNDARAVGEEMRRIAQSLSSSASDNIICDGLLDSAKADEVLGNLTGCQRRRENLTRLRNTSPGRFQIQLTSISLDGDSGASSFSQFDSAGIQEQKKAAGRGIFLLQHCFDLRMV